MLQTLSGYAGGSSADPTYERLGDHTESVQVVYDQSLIGYDELLAVFWDAHDPTSRPYLDQYRNAIFTRDAGQQRLAATSRERIASQFDRPVRTAIVPAGTFTPAETYHQKYYLQRNGPLLDWLEERYPDRQELIRSTEAARLNGFLGCHGDPATLWEDLGRLGLPAALQRELFEVLTLTCGEFRGAVCPLPARN